MGNKNKKILNPLQFGFKGERGCINCLTLQVKLRFSKNEFTIAVMLDLKAAYDCVDRNLLITKPRGLGIRGQHIQIIQESL